MRLPSLKAARYFTSILALAAGITTLFSVYETVTVPRGGKQYSSEQQHSAEEWKSQKFDFVPTNFKLVQVVQICHNKDSVRKLITFVKSLLFYRSTPILMHILTNEPTSISIREVFRTWVLPYFEIKLYIRPDVEEATSWIPYVHPAGKYAFKKLLIHEIITDAEKVIFYDADIVLTADIYELWRRFDDFDHEQVIGMGYETQLWYGRGGKEVWPAIDWGFNTGMIMYQLDRLRENDFAGRWKDKAKEHLKTQRYAWLAEQDILNSFFLHFPRHLYKTPCVWNVQLGERFRIDSCPHVRNYLAFHITLEKLADASPDEVPLLPQYSDVLNTFMNLNGGIFGTSSEKYYRIFPFVTDFQPDGNASVTDVSLVLFLQASDIGRLGSVISTWQGQMSIAIGGSDRDFALVNKLPSTKNVAYHFVFQNPGSLEVPERVLKTFAIRLAPSTHFIIGDIRFHIRNQTYAILKKSLLENEDSFVAIPQFVTKCHVFKSFRSKTQLSNQINEGKIATIPEMNPELYQRWFEKKESFEITWDSELDKYIMMPKSRYPLFNTPYKEMELENVDIGNEWLKQKIVKILPNGLALMIPDLGKMFGEPGFSIRC